MVACLWPFNPYPKNEVWWLRSEPGLEFGDYGTVFSKSNFNGDQRIGACSFEVWMEPGLTFDSATIFAFYRPVDAGEFKISQTEDSLGVVRAYPGGSSASDPDYIAVRHAFRAGVPLLISVASDGKNAQVYFDGKLIKEAPLELTNHQFSGKFVFGNSPVENNTWSGKLRGLAFYGSKLTPQEVLGHYGDWISGNTKALAIKDTIALYTFKEGYGALVHNQFGPGPDLFIPRHYQILHQGFLVPAWKEYAPTSAYWKDVCENILGFVPLGFFLCAYGNSRRMMRAGLWTVLFGAALSFVIEIIQSQLPMRDSSMTDVISNTLGTIFGTLVYGTFSFLRSGFRRTL